MVSDSYDHALLREFDAVAGPVDVPDIFLGQFVSDEVFHRFVTETNGYAMQKAEKVGSSAIANSRVRLWKEVRFDWHSWLSARRVESPLGWTALSALIALSSITRPLFSVISVRVPLCPYPCFNRYHTRVHFKIQCTP